MTVGPFAWYLKRQPGFLALEFQCGRHALICNLVWI